MPYGFIRTGAPIPGSGTPSPFGGWQLPSSPANAYYGVTWSPALGLFLVVTRTPSLPGGRAASSPNGLNWTQRNLDAAGLWEAVTWSPNLGLFCAVANEPGAGVAISTSPDGITWTNRVSPIADRRFLDVAWNSDLGLFAAVGIPGNVITSPDGINWTDRGVTIAGPLEGIASGLISGVSGFVAVAGNSATQAQRAMTSTDGIIWSPRATPNVNHHWQGVAYSPDLNIWVAVGGSSQVPLTDKIMSSPNGITWTIRPNPKTDVSNFRGIAWSPELGMFIAVMDNTGTGNTAGRKFMFSTDGITWNFLTSPLDQNWRNIAWSPALERFVIVSFSGTKTIATMT